MTEVEKKAIEAFKKLFPKADMPGQLMKLEEELNEFKEAESIDELADVCIVCFGLMALKSHIGAFIYSVIVDELTVEELKKLEQVIDTKVDINLSRKWEYKDGKYKHIK